MTNKAVTDGTTDHGELIVERQDGWARLTLNRPHARNALKTSLLEDIAAALNGLDMDPSVHCAVITGGPKIFAAGADINELAEKDAAASAFDARGPAWGAIRRFSKPLIAAVNGYCLGAGNELLMCCDIAIAAEDAKFGQPELNVGVMPGAGGTQVLPRLAGKMAAMRMVLLGDFLGAEEARAYGLVTEVTAPDAVLPRAEEIAAVLAAKPPVAMRLAKQSILQSFETPLSAGLAHEKAAFSLLFSTSDKAEGVAAFQEKRKPRFSGY